jgi:tellurite resistance protein
MFPLLSVTDLSAETCLAAALAVCDRARDAAEARDLLEMCGLLGVRP